MQSTDFLLGMILPYGGSDIAPSTGWLMCDGKGYDTSVNAIYTPLKGKIGTRFGGGYKEQTGKTILYTNSNAHENYPAEATGALTDIPNDRALYSPVTNATTNAIASQAGHYIDGGTADFTVESWVKITSSTTGISYPVMGQGTYGSNDWWLFVFYNDAGKCQVYFYWKDASTYRLGGYSVSASAPSLSTDTWYHIAYMLKSGVQYIFINGQQMSFTQDYASSSRGNTAFDAVSLIMNWGGGWSASSARPWYSDQYRISNIARYNTGSAGDQIFTPSRSLYTADANDTFLLQFDSRWFNVPDLRGMFIRGRDAGAGRDSYGSSRVRVCPGGCSGDAVGSYQQDQFMAHCHHFYVCNNVQTTGGGTQWWNTNPGAGTCPPYLTTVGTGHGADSRPINVGVNYIIKY